MRKALIGLVSTGLAVLCAVGDTRFHQYTKQYMNPPTPAKPVSAGYIGGEGDEYLAGGAFLPDGSVLLGGVAFGGADFWPAGVRALVIGDDDRTPASTVTESKDSKGRVQLSIPDWQHTAGAGFIVQLEPGGRTVRKAVRFGWGSGSLTDVLATPAGEVFVTGICGERFSGLTAVTEVETGIEGTGAIYLGRLKRDLSGFEWCRKLMDDTSNAPKLELLKDGRIALTSTYAYHFSVEGKLLKATKVQTTSNWVRGVDPMSHATATGGDGNTNTGWEPWRKPVLFVYNDRGEHTDVFYRWSEKLVGQNSCRLVSDSSVRLLRYDNDGNLLVAGWSDGGNTVFEYLPYDLRTRVSAKTGNDGLGFSTWGAGVGSFCHLIKIDPRTGEPLGKTLFVAYLKGSNKPNGLRVSDMNSGADGSLLLGGSSSYGLIETGAHKVNTLDWESDDYIGGPFVAVLTKKMDSIRFSSCIPGGGAVSLSRQSKKVQGKWGTRSAVVNGKPMALFICGAKQSDKFKALNTAQPQFGGGKLDGLYLVLEL